MRKTLFALLLVASCDVAPPGAESSTATNTALHTDSLAAVRYAPERLIAQAEAAIGADDWRSAAVFARLVMEKHPEAPEAGRAGEIIEKADSIFPTENTDQHRTVVRLRRERDPVTATSSRFESVAAALEANPQITVERDPAAPKTMRIHIDRLDITELQARQIASMAHSRLGDDYIVRVYDASGLLLARATAYGTK